MPRISNINSECPTAFAALVTSDGTYRDCGVSMLGGIHHNLWE